MKLHDGTGDDPTCRDIRRHQATLRDRLDSATDPEKETAVYWFLREHPDHIDGLIRHLAHVDPDAVRESLDAAGEPE